MLGGHIYELLIVLFWLVVIAGGAYLLVRVAAGAAAREYTRAQAKERRQRRP